MVAECKLILIIIIHAGVRQVQMLKSAAGSNKWDFFEFFDKREKRIYFRILAKTQGPPRLVSHVSPPPRAQFSCHFQVTSPPMIPKANPPPHYRNPVLQQPTFSTSSTPPPPLIIILSRQLHRRPPRFAVETRLLGCARATEQRAVGGGRRERYTMSAAVCRSEYWWPRLFGRAGAHV